MNIARTGVFQTTALLVLLTISPMALGADTVETWDEGATDVDMYFGADGIGANTNARHIFGDMMLGYGIIDGFSVYLGTTLHGDETMSRGSGDIYLGMFGTAVDTDHFDLDLFFDVGLSGDALNKFQMGPAIELNFDLTQQRRSWGMYLRAGVPIYGRAISSPKHPDTPDTEMSFHLEATIGAYWTMYEGHQLLAEFDIGFHPKPAPDERDFDIGGVAIGYNLNICEAIELVNQVYINVPQQAEPLSAGIMLGFIATIP